jgi:hypothetical protein
MIAKLRSILSQNVNNIRGWKTNRKIIVIESDDWGSIRMPSKEVYNKLENFGIDVNNCSYCKFDALASETDLSLFFEVLKSHKTNNNKWPVVTANVIVANPNFKKIKESNFNEYSFEIFTETLCKNDKDNSSFDLWKKGIADHIFYPQLHGREHLNIKLWMDYLRKGSLETRFSFDLEMFGISTNITKEKRKSYMAALNFQKMEELDNQKEILKEAQNIFKNIFGFASKSFIAPNYVWSSEIEETLKEIGIEYIQSGKHQIIPDGARGKINYIRHYVGQRNKHNQIYLVRNCSFEPSINNSKTIVEDCLSQIEAAFRWKKPAIISSHRLNYIGSIDEKNRTKNLEHLDELLGKIIKRWPNVEFMTSDELGDLIKNN